jgi:DNA-directed RNA polymerase subunit beta'
VEELFEARKKPRGEAVMSDIDGIVNIARTDSGVRLLKVTSTQMVKDEYDVPGNWALKVEAGQEVQEGQVIASRGEQEMMVKHGGKVQMRKNKPLAVVYEVVDEREYEAPVGVRLLVEDGQEIAAGQQLSEGALNPHRILRILGREAAQLYLMSEVQRVYRSQGVNINDKHFEVIIRKMMNRVQIVSSGDTELLPGELVDRLVLQDINEGAGGAGQARRDGSAGAAGRDQVCVEHRFVPERVVVQHTIKVLAGAAIEGKQDDLRGLKENVIIGKLIPAGTGFKGSLYAPQEMATDEVPVGETIEEVPLAE